MLIGSLEIKFYTIWNEIRFRNKEMYLKMVVSVQLRPFCPRLYVLIHWGWVTHIYVSQFIIIGSDNGLSPDRRQAIIWTIDGILLIERLWTNFSEILIRIQIFSFKKMRLKMSSAKWRSFCLGLNVLIGKIDRTELGGGGGGCIRYRNMRRSCAKLKFVNVTHYNIKHQWAGPLFDKR